MPDLASQRVGRYLEQVLGEPVRVEGITPIAGSRSSDIKEYGYGVPLEVQYTVDDQEHRCVLDTIRPSSFGHEHMADRAGQLLWSHGAYNRLPRHVRSLDVGGFCRDGRLLSLGEVEEVFLLYEFADGEGYFRDLERLRQHGGLLELDQARADALCDYLLQIHRVPGPEPELYVRRIRELLGHGECIMGLIDSYMAFPQCIAPQTLRQIEQRCVEWRWRIKDKTHRLRQVHGDFHPWNILFRHGTDFTLLDRSRGEWGDPADDVTCLTLNYLFFGLQRSGRLDGDFQVLFQRFWDRYLAGSGDRELLSVAAPFVAFRALVMASPIWYPALPDPLRGKLLAMICNVLEAESFDPARMNEYCQS